MVWVVPEERLGERCALDSEDDLLCLARVVDPAPSDRRLDDAHGLRRAETGDSAHCVLVDMNCCVARSEPVQPSTTSRSRLLVPAHTHSHESDTGLVDRTDAWRRPRCRCGGSRGSPLQIASDSSGSTNREYARAASFE